MKSAQFTHSFKTVTRENGEKVKRDPIAINYSAIESADVADLDSTQVAVILNDALVSYAKKLVMAKADDWSYVPDESEITLSAVYDDLTSPSKRGQRLITKQSLAKFASYYREVCVTILGKSERAAIAGEQVINSKFTLIAAKPDAIATFKGNLLALIESDDFDTETYAELLAALIDILESLEQPEFDADAL